MTNEKARKSIDDAIHELTNPELREKRKREKELVDLQEEQVKDYGL